MGSSEQTPFQRHQQAEQALFEVEGQARDYDQGPSMPNEGPTTSEIVERARAVLGDNRHRFEERQILLGTEAVPEGLNELVAEREQIAAELTNQLEQAMERQQQLREKFVEGMDLPQAVKETYRSGTAEYETQSRFDDLADHNIRAERIAVAQEANDAVVMEILNSRVRGALVGEVAISDQYSDHFLESYFADGDLQKQMAELFARLKTFDARDANDRYYNIPQAKHEQGRGVYMSAQLQPKKALGGGYQQEPDNRRWKALVALSRKLHAVDPERFPLLSGDGKLSPSAVQHTLDAQNKQVDRLQGHTEQNIWERVYFDARKKDDTTAGQEAWKKLGPEKRALVSMASFVQAWPGPELSPADRMAVSSFYRARHEAQANPGNEESYRTTWSALSSDLRQQVRRLLEQESLK